MLRLANEHLYAFVVVVYPMKGVVTRSVVRIGLVPNLTNVLKEHLFSADAFLCAFEQLEVTCIRVLARLTPPEMLMYLKKEFNFAK